MLESIGLLQLSAQRMRYLSQRQVLIGQNIANADTPGYRAKDLTPFITSEPLAQSGQQSIVLPLQLVATNPAHIGFSGSGDVNALVNSHAKTYGEKLDSNNVSIEEQEMKANDVANAYDLASTAYKKSIDLLKESLGASA
jgi:flagellar basal-body rod protein FlgB